MGNAVQDKLRRRRLGFAVALVAAIVALLWGVDAWLDGLAADRDTGRALRQVSQVALLLRVAAAVVAALLGHVLLDWARQGTQQDRWPPKGLEWPGQAEPLQGLPAQRVVRLIRLAGLVCWSMAALLAAWSAWIALA